MLEAYSDTQLTPSLKAFLGPRNISRVQVRCLAGPFLIFHGLDFGGTISVSTGTASDRVQNAPNPYFEGLYLFLSSGTLALPMALPWRSPRHISGCCGVSKMSSCDQNSEFSNFGNTYTRLLKLIV